MKTPCPIHVPTSSSMFNFNHRICSFANSFNRRRDQHLPRPTLCQDLCIFWVCVCHHCKYMQLLARSCIGRVLLLVFPSSIPKRPTFLFGPIIHRMIQTLHWFYFIAYTWTNLVVGLWHICNCLYSVVSVKNIGVDSVWTTQESQCH